MSIDYTALIRNAKDIPVLNTGIDSSVTSESTFPTKEHPSLLTHTGKTINTPLNNTLSARHIKVPTNPKDPHYADKHTLASIKKNALTLSFRGHRDGKVPRIEWDQYYLHLLPLVLEHPKLMLAQSKEMSETLRKIYKASSDFIGDASLSAEQQVALKTRSLCIPLLADNPWEPSDEEDDTISEIVLEDRGLDAIPNDGSEERTKFDNVVVQYKRTMAYLREILNHTFLRAVFHTSSRQAKLEYQEVQRNFINDHSNDDPDDEPVKFTALNIIEYIEDDCVCSNDKALQSITNTMSKMVRYNGQTLLDWLQSFVPIVNKYLKATAQQVLDTDESKALWKAHFASQITLAEKTQMLVFQSQHLRTADIRLIQHLNEGEFDEKTLQKLVTKLSSTFEPYKPDKAIMQYLNQHTRQLGLEPPSFASPKEKQHNSGKSERQKLAEKLASSDRKKNRTDRSNKKRKRTDASDLKSRSDGKSGNKKDKGKVPFGKHCRRASCKQRGTHKNHAHDDCRFKDRDASSTSHKHPNLGKAPRKNKDYKSKSDIKSPAPVPAAINHDRKCYICNDPNHLANACPQKGKHKHKAKAKLQANKSFMTLFKSSFPSLEQQACATRMIDTWGEDHICSSCIQPSFFAHECNTHDSNVIKHVAHVRQTIASTPLLHHIQEAHKPQHPSLQASNTVLMDTSFFLQAEGHSAVSTGEQSPIHQYESQGDESDNQSDSDESDNQSGSNSRSSEEDTRSDTHSDNASNSNSDDNHDSQYNDNALYSDSENSNEE